MITVVARARLQRMVADAVDPTLTTPEVDDLMLIAQEADSYGRAPDYKWYASSYIPAGVYVIPTTPNGHHYRILVAGTTGTVEPVWPLGAGATIVDGTVTWQEGGAPNWLPSYDLNRAAAEGWRWKAAKASDRFNFSNDNANFQGSQVHTHCLKMADVYQNKAGSRPKSIRAMGNLVVDRYANLTTVYAEGVLV